MIFKLAALVSNIMSQNQLNQKFKLIVKAPSIVIYSIRTSKMITYIVHSKLQPQPALSKIGQQIDN